MTDKEERSLSQAIAELNVAKVSLEIAATRLSGSWHASRPMTTDKSVSEALEDLVAAVDEMRERLAAPCDRRSRAMKNKLEAILPPGVRRALYVMAADNLAQQDREAQITEVAK